MAYAERASFEFHKQPCIQVSEWITLQSGVVDGPERSLMIALMFDGIVTCLNYAGDNSQAGRKRYQEAIAWVCAPSSEYIFSFENVCDCLGIDSAALRKGIICSCNSRAKVREKKSRRTF